MSHKRFLSVIGGLLALTLLSACAQKPKSSPMGDFTGRDSYTVLVLAEDSDGASFPRSSRIHQQIITKAQGQLRRQGFIVKDGDHLAVDAGFRLHDYMSKSDLIEAVKLMTNRNKAASNAQAFVLVRSLANLKGNSFSNALQTHLEGEIFDIKSNRFLGSFTTPTRLISRPTDCDRHCAENLVSNETSQLADDFGAAMARKLASLTGSRTIADDSYEDAKPSTKGLKKGTFIFSLKGFNTEEALEILRVMSKEFPGYKSHDLISRNNRHWTYEYQSKASLGKLEQWVNILLLDMGYNPDSDVDIRFSNKHFHLTLKDSSYTAQGGSFNKPTGSARFF